MKWWQLALCGLALLSACDNEKKPESPTLTSDTPLGLEEALLYVAADDSDERLALLLDLAQNKPKAALHALPAGEVKMWPRTGVAGEVLLLTQGRSAKLDDGEAKDAIDSYLLRYNRTGELARYQLTGRYGQLAVSDDGRFAVAFSPSGNWSSADSIVVIDLERADDSQRVPATGIRTLNGVGPTNIVFAPSSAGRRLAVLIMADAVNLLDLENAGARDKVLPLKLPTGSAQLRAQKVLFHEDRIFVQSDQGSDVIVAQVADDATSASGFRASLSALATDGPVKDIALLEEDGQVRLLALGARSLRTIDITTGADATSALSASFERVHVFNGRSPFDDQVKPRAFLYGARSTQLGFVDLTLSLRGNERTLEVLTLPTTPRAFVLPSGQSLALITHEASGVSLVDLNERTVSTLQTESPARNVVLDDAAARAWVTTERGEIGAIDLTTRTPQSLLLDEPAQAIVPLNDDAGHIAVTHTSQVGRITVVDGAQPTRGSAREIVGFALSGFLD